MSGSSERSLVSVPAKGIDPLLMDLNEKKESFRKNVVSFAAELKDVRRRLASREQLFARETLMRQEAETRARTLEDEIDQLHLKLEEKNEQIHASTGYAQEYLKELDALRSQLAITQAIADVSAASAQSAQLQCLALLKELDEKNISIMEHESRVDRLAEQLENLQRDLQARESSQKRLQDEVVRIGHDIMQVVAKAGVTKDGELRKIMEEVSPKSIDNFNKLWLVKDEEIAKLQDEIRTMSSHWKIKTSDLESQLEKQRRADQELKKRVLKLEFSLQEARTQTRKLQRLEKESLNVAGLQVILSAGSSSEVCGESSGVVDIDQWECSCRVRQLTGLPCRHAIAVIRCIGQSPHNYCSSYFSTESNISTYLESVNPIPDVDKYLQNNKANVVVTVTPPPTRRPLGRPTTKRS